MNHIRNIILLFCFSLIGVLSASAADYYVRGVAYCILDDGSGYYPISEAGEVFVSTTADAVPQWTAGTYTSETVSGSHAASGSSVSFCFWARAKAGYSFVGWGSTKTSKNPTSGTELYEGKPWSSKTTLWSAKTEENPNELVRYAIFRKNAEEDTSGGGVEVSSVSDHSHVFGSTNGEWSVNISYAEPLAYRDFSGYTDGYGVNTSLIASITCREKTTGEEVSVTSVKVMGSYAAAGADAHAAIYFPAAMPVGSYDVHLPKGLFNTQSGGVTAATDFVVDVALDSSPLTIVESRPANEGTWNADPESDFCDGENILFTFTFNRSLRTVHAEGKEFLLTNTATGRTNRAADVVINQLNPYQGLVIFGSVPSGEYTFFLPEGTFCDLAGIGNESETVTFTVTGSLTEEWVLPTYHTVTASPANNSTVPHLNDIRLAFAANGYDAPTYLSPDLAVSACKLWVIYEEGVDYSDPHNRPLEKTEDIEGIKVSVVDGELLISIATAFEEKTDVLVVIPAGLVYNVDVADALSDQERYERGACTNARVTLQYHLDPSLMVGMDAPVLDGSAVEAFSLDGRPATTPSGLRILRTTAPTGEVTTRKVMR